MSEQTLMGSESKEVFSNNVANTLNDIYTMFIGNLSSAFKIFATMHQELKQNITNCPLFLLDGQLYSNAAKEMRRPKISTAAFGIKYFPKVVEIFHNEAIVIEDSPRVGILAQLLLTSYVQPLKSLLQKCFEQNQFLVQEQSFEELSEYQKVTTSILKDKTEELMRIVLGTSSSLWAEAFYPIFQQKCEQVAKMKTDLLFQYLDEETFPKYKKYEIK